MSLQLETVAQACQQITKQVKEHYKVLTVHFIIHHDGQRNEALGITAQEIVHHPAAQTAMRIMQQPKLSEQSSLLGIAVARTHMFMGLAWRDHLLALCNINIDHFQNIREVRQQAWHLAWHALDGYFYHEDPDGRIASSTNIIVRRRSALEMMRANLQADVLSAVMCGLQGDRDALKQIAVMRSLNAITPRSAHMPEFYPYPIAVEAVEYAVSELGKKLPSKRLMIPTALKVAREVDLATDDQTLMNWLSFCEPAQDMAWRGFSKPDILSAAINTSPDTFVRTTSHLIQELTSIKASSFIDIGEKYSPYADDEINANLHDKLIDHIFEDIIAKGLSLHSADPFIKMADKQNEDLSEGRVMGWCAAALQAAARILERTPEGDRRTEHLVRREFREHKDDSSWETLRDLSNRVIEHQREGEIITLSRLAEIAGEDKASRAIQASIQKTISNPDYQAKLEYINSPAPQAPAPKAPALSAAPRLAMPPPGGPRGPGIGSGSRPQILQQAVRSGGDSTGDQGRQTQK
ncbi:MAG: hypothetical protein HYS17_05090 [Micavibrio aeruginosavorus]|uniref:Uncharacterized protein n=1 Tax=Micavibrio aeruginosavorus TaxID=349221 RepID=A0A7T5R402_9BACT|nr:MAG: hypothetical protein HYS17_05090 [Micavibrio aeruginosavorus]